MTRRIVAVALAGLMLVTTGCGGDRKAGAASNPTTEGWVTAPVIDSVARTAGSLLLRGHARPGSRIVVRGEDGTAFAVGAGDDGRFDIRMRPPQTDVFYVIEVQTGQDAVPSPFRLLVPGDPGGPIALIAAGSPTRRLDPGAGLDVVDSDGRSRIASGRAAPRTTISVEVDGRSPLTTTTDKEGRWSVGLDGRSDGPVTISVAGQSYVYPGVEPPDGETGRLVVAGQGRAVRWSLSETAQQTSWFPDPSER